MANLLKIVSVVFVSSFVFLNSREASLKPEPTKVQLFVKNLINTKFGQCTLLLLQDVFDSDLSFNYFVQNTKINFFNIKFNKNNLNENKTLPVTFPITVGNYHRRSRQCLIALIMVTEENPRFFQMIFDTITPVYIPITRKDEDHFIFLTKTNIMKKTLLNKQLSTKIKFKIGVYEKSDGVLSILSVCFFCEGGNYSFVEYKENGVDNYFEDFVTNLNGKILRIACPYIRAAIETDAPWTGISNARRGHWKMMFDKFLTVKFNFTYNSFIATGMDGNFGGGGTGLLLDNGTWIGITGDIISGKAELGAVIANTPKRIRVIDFTSSFYDVGHLVFVTAKGKRDFSPEALLWPFDIGMWSCLGFSTLSTFLFSTCLNKAMNVFQSARDENWSFTIQMQFIFASLVGQGATLPRFAPLRFFVALWLFFTLVVTHVYRSKMVTLIAFPISERIPQTFKELAYSGYGVGFMKHGDSAYNTLAASTDPVYVKLLLEMEIIEGVGLECLEKVLKYKYGCIAYDFALAHLIERNLSDSNTRQLTFAPATTYNIWLGLALEGKSIYKIIFGKWLSYIRPFHLADIWNRIDMYNNVRRLKRQWWEQTNQTRKFSTKESAESTDLTLKQFSGAFSVLFGGLSISSFVFIVELLKYHFQTKITVNKIRATNFIISVLKSIKEIYEFKTPIKNPRKMNNFRTNCCN